MAIVTWCDSIQSSFQLTNQSTQFTFQWLIFPLYNPSYDNWLVVSTHLKNMSQIGSSPQVGMKIKNIWNHHLDKLLPWCFPFCPLWISWKITAFPISITTHQSSTLGYSALDGFSKTSMVNSLGTSGRHRMKQSRYVKLPPKLLGAKVGPKKKQCFSWGKLKKTNN